MFDCDAAKNEACYKIVNRSSSIHGHCAITTSLIQIKGSCNGPPRILSDVISTIFQGFFQMCILMLCNCYLPSRTHFELFHDHLVHDHEPKLGQDVAPQHVRPMSTRSMNSF